mgnify:FL=1
METNVALLYTQHLPLDLANEAFPMIRKAFLEYGLNTVWKEFSTYPSQLDTWKEGAPNLTYANTHGVLVTNDPQKELEAFHSHYAGIPY